MLRRAITIVDVLVCLVVLLLVATAGLAWQRGVDDVENWVRCASNLRRIGQAISNYAKENRGGYPRTAYQSGAAPKPTWGTPYEGDAELGPVEAANPFAKDDSPGAKTRPKPNDVTAPLFLLMRTQEITSAAFVCPATFQEKFAFGGGPHHALHWTNWPGAKGLREHLGYSYQNPYPSNDAVAAGFRFNATVDKDFVVAGDLNPGAGELTKVGLNAGPQTMQKLNSPNHNRSGQNMLYGDGRVEFQSNPFCGVKRDNVYTFGPGGEDHPDKGGEGIVGSPTHASDSILLPTARDIGAADEQGNAIEFNPPQPLSAAEQGDVRNKLAGTWARDEDNDHLKLEINGAKFTASKGAQTIAFAYEIVGTRDGYIYVTLTGPDVDAHRVALKVEAEGTLIVRGNPYLRGEWKRQP